MRIGIGLMVLVDLATRLPDLTAFYTDNGILTRAFVKSSYFIPGAWSLHMLSGDSGFQLFLFGTAAIAGLMLLLGYKTRIATIISWILLLSLQNRAPIVLHGGDELLRTLLFWGCFLPLSAQYSLDHLTSKNRLRHTVPQTSNTIFSVASIAFILQILMLYIFSALHKTSPDWHTNGNAGYYALSLSNITTGIGHAFIMQYHSHPNFWHPLFQVFTRITYYFELFGSLLFMFPFWHGRFRLLGVVGFVSFHLAMGSLFQLGIFPWVDIIALLAFIPSCLWNQALFKNKPTPNTPSTLTPCPVSTPVFYSLFKYSVVTISLLAVLGLNLISLNPKAINRIPQHAVTASVALGLGQSWSMFAPHPMKHTSHYWIEQTTRNTLSPKNKTKNNIEHRTKKLVYPNERWSKLMTLAVVPEPHLGLFRQYADFLCQQKTKDNQPIAHIRISYQNRRTPPPTPIPVPKPLPTRQFERQAETPPIMPIWSQACTAQPTSASQATAFDVR